MEQINSTCPSCGHATAKLHLETKDYFLSKEPFSILICDACTLAYTWPRPKESEISAYYKSEEYVSHSSTNKGLVNKVYGFVRNYTLKQKIKLIQRVSFGKNLLDIGAGTGHFVSIAQKNNFSVVGLEPDEDARKQAKNIHNLDLLDLNDLAMLPNNSFDCITMWHVLEHVYNLSKDVKTIASKLKTKGVWIIAVPNYTSHDAKFYGEKWAAFDVPRHLYHFTPESVKNIIEEQGLEMIEILPMKFDAFYVSMLSEKYKNGSMFSAFKRGMISNFKAKKGQYSSQIYVFRKK